jgi:HNH endonuclease
MIPNNTDYWRALILYGKFQSTYKIGLGQCLLSYAQENRDKVDLDTLAGDFLDLYTERCKTGRSQLATKGRLTYVERELQEISSGVKNREQSLPIVKKNALSDMVLKRFNVLNNRVISEPFYTVTQSDLILNENLLSIVEERSDHDVLVNELHSRWDLLEHAFEQSNNIELLDVDQNLQYIRKQEKRTNLTKLVPTLIGYQQNRCFYCGEELYDIVVDHMIPYQAVRHNKQWNLVLAHDFCNENKSDNLPSIHFVENLIKRNEYFIASSHPIKDTLVADLGFTARARMKETLKAYNFAKNKIGRMWGGDPHYNPQKDRFYREWVRILANKS